MPADMMKVDRRRSEVGGFAKITDPRPLYLLSYLLNQHANIADQSQRVFYGTNSVLFSISDETRMAVIAASPYRVPQSEIAAIFILLSVSLLLCTSLRLILSFISWIFNRQN